MLNVVLIDAVGIISIDEDATKLPLIVTLSSNLPVEFTSNPLSGSTDAVTEPVAILNASSVIAERGISNNPAPLPLNIDADNSLATIKLPSIEPDVFTTNPKFGETDAVTEPLEILLISNDSADSGILNNPSPLPLKKPLPDGISTLPIKIEPLSTEVTLN